jgi:hypothetical protein
VLSEKEKHQLSLLPRPTLLVLGITEEERALLLEGQNLSDPARQKGVEEALQYWFAALLT